MRVSSLTRLVPLSVPHRRTSRPGPVSFLRTSKRAHFSSHLPNPPPNGAEPREALAHSKQCRTKGGGEEAAACTAGIYPREPERAKYIRFVPNPECKAQHKFGRSALRCVQVGLVGSLENRATCLDPLLGRFPLVPPWLLALPISIATPRNLAPKPNPLVKCQCGRCTHL